MSDFQTAVNALCTVDGAPIAKVQFKAVIWRAPTFSEASSEAYSLRLDDNCEELVSRTFPYLDMSLQWPYLLSATAEGIDEVDTDGHLEFTVHLKPNQALRYLNRESTHRESTFRSIPQGVFRRLTSLTSDTEYFNTLRIDELYPHHAAALHAAGLAPAIFPTIGSIRDSIQPVQPPADGVTDRPANNQQTVYVCLGVSDYWIVPIHKLIKKLLTRYNLPWFKRYRMSYHRFPNFADSLRGVLTSKLSRFVTSATFPDHEPCNCQSNHLGRPCILVGDAAGQCRQKNVVYKLTCGFCQHSYIGNTSRHLKRRVYEHLTDVTKCIHNPVGHTATGNNGLRSSSTRFAKHLAKCWRDTHVLGATPTVANLRKQCEISILWRGSTLSCHKSFRDWDCRLCQQERIALIRARFFDSDRRYDHLINKNLELLGTCKHRTRFHPLTLTDGNTSADDPT